MSFTRWFRVMERESHLFRRLFVASVNIARSGFATNRGRLEKDVITDFKRPPNAFQLFAGEKRSVAAKENPDKSPQEIMTLLAEKWKGLSEEEKTSYKKVSSEKLEQYNAPLQKLPRRPPGVFGLFVRENYSRIVGENPEVDAKKIISKLSDAWNDLSSDEKEEWKQKRDRIVEMYKQEVVNFERDLSEEERAFLLHKQGPRMEELKKEKRKLLGYPRRPPSPFIVFLQKSEGRLEGESVIERSTKLGQRWREMGDDEKDIYREESRKAREKYDLDVEQWKERHQY